MVVLTRDRPARRRLSARCDGSPHVDPLPHRGICDCVRRVTHVAALESRFVTSPNSHWNDLVAFERSACCAGLAASNCVRTARKRNGARRPFHAPRSRAGRRPFGSSAGIAFPTRLRGVQCSTALLRHRPQAVVVASPTLDELSSPYRHSEPSHETPSASGSERPHRGERDRWAFLGPEMSAR